MSTSSSVSGRSQIGLLSCAQMKREPVFTIK
jgi:hypothetical protein